MLKFVGGVFIVLSSYFFGIVKSNEYKMQLMFLKQYKTDLIYLKNNISFSKKPIFELIEELINSETILKGVYSDFIDLSKLKNFEIAWAEAIEKAKLTEKVKKYFKTFPDLFCVIDLVGQIDVLDNYILNIEEEIENFTVYLDKNEKLFRNTGLYIGILTAVLLI